MKSNKFLIGGIVGSIASFVLFYVVYDLLFLNYFNTNSVTAVDMTAMKWWANIISSLAFGFLFAYILGKANATSASTGAGIGFVVGLLVEISFDFGYYSVGQGFKSLSGLCVDVIVTAVICAIIGAVVVAAGGMGSKKPAAA